MLAREKAVLGFYITKHPLASHETLLKACATATTVDLSKYNDGDEVVLGGMVSSLRSVTTRNGRNAGKQIGIVTLEDLSGKVEAILFSDDLVKYRSMIMPDAIVFLEGTVDRKREEPSLRISRVIPNVEAASELAKALLIDVNAETPIDELAELLKQHKGLCPVYLNVETTDDLIAQIECHAGLRVSCNSEFLRSLYEITGQGAAHVLGSSRIPIPVCV